MTLALVQPIDCQFHTHLFLGNFINFVDLYNKFHSVEPTNTSKTLVPPTSVPAPPFPLFPDYFWVLRRYSQRNLRQVCLLQLSFSTGHVERRGAAPLPSCNQRPAPCSPAYFPQDRPRPGDLGYQMRQWSVSFTQMLCKKCWHCPFSSVTVCRVGLKAGVHLPNLYVHPLPFLKAAFLSLEFRANAWVWTGQTLSTMVSMCPQGSSPKQPCWEVGSYKRWLGCSLMNGWALSPEWTRFSRSRLVIWRVDLFWKWVQLSLALSLRCFLITWPTTGRARLWHSKKAPNRFGSSILDFPASRALSQYISVLHKLLSLMYSVIAVENFLRHSPPT
jgi:hypothetical protein